MLAVKLILINGWHVWPITVFPVIVFYVLLCLMIMSVRIVSTFYLGRFTNYRNFHIYG